MRSLLIILLVLLASVWLGLEIAQHPDQLFFTYHHWVVEMPLWFAILSLGIAFLLFYFLLRSLSFIDNLAASWRGWLNKRRSYKAYNKTQRGLLELMQENWVVAERYLVDGAKQTKSPVINYLGAAEAACEQKAYARSDAYLRKAYQLAPQDEVVIGLTQAKLQLEQGQLEQTAILLAHLRELAPYNKGVLTLLEKYYIRISDWQNLLKLLPSLEKAKVIDAEHAQIFEKNIYCELFDEAARKKVSLHAVRELWLKVPKKLRFNPEVLTRYARLVKNDKESAQELEPVIRKILNKEWEPDLAAVYGSLSACDSAQQLAAAEAWQKKWGNRPGLLLLLGRLCLRCQLWGKARANLEESLDQEPKSEARLLLAKLFEQLEEAKLALQTYRDGLELAAKKEGN